MTPHDDLTALETIANAATPGPYQWDKRELCVYAPDGRIMFDRSVDCDDTDEADAQFIAAFNPTVALRLLTELREARQTVAGRQWRPIATAPKMRKVLVFYRNALGKGRCVLACYYEANALEMHDDYADVGTYDEATGNSYAPEGWYEEHESEEPLLRITDEITHWMPLPAPPKDDRPDCYCGDPSCTGRTNGVCPQARTKWNELLGGLATPPKDGE